MKKLLPIIAIMTMVLLQSCLKTDEMWSAVDDLKTRIAALEAKVGVLNNNTTALYRLKQNDVVVCGVTLTPTGYKLELSDGTTIPISLGEEMPTLVPVIGIDTEGYWTYSLDNGTTFTRLLVENKPVVAYPEYSGKPAAFPPKIKVNAEGYWLVSYDDGATYTNIVDSNNRPVVASGEKVTYSGYFESLIFDEQKKHLDILLKDGSALSLLVKDNFGITIGAPDPDTFMAGETRYYEVVQTNVAEAMVMAPEGWIVELQEKQLKITSPGIVRTATTEKIAVVVTSAEGFIRSVTINAKLSTEVYDANSVAAWNKFKTGTADNVLLDFSYAGYKMGEVSIPDVSTLGLETFNILNYGAIANDNISDRAAFLAAVDAAKAKGGGIVYFPRGRYILHDATDDPEPEKSAGIYINMSNLILKGDGRDESIIEMASKNYPANAELYSSPSLIQIKHNTGVVYGTTMTTVTGDSPKGSFTVTVANTTTVKVGEWVCLRLKNNDPTLVAEELAPHSVDAKWTNIAADGVNVEEFHRVKSKTATTITFYEPILYAVQSKWNWTIHEYRNYTNVGVEDLCFRGHCKDNYIHHGSWEDDGAFKMIDFVRLTDSWMRRLKFENVSEGGSIALSANITIADVIVEGFRGHSSIRSQGSSRVFMGKVTDRSTGKLTGGSTIIPGAGQFHGVGVSKPSMGAVLWNNDWGTDACFEAHASQPRATLFDICTGGFIDYHAGGDISQLPNHLNDLTMWNFNSKNTVDPNFLWWNDSRDFGLRIMPPIIVGFMGSGTTPFANTTPDQIKYIESSGVQAGPHSLYEAQLRKRLGFVPAWLNALKSITQ